MAGYGVTTRALRGRGMSLAAWGAALGRKGRSLKRGREWGGAGVPGERGRRLAPLFITSGLSDA